MDEGTFDEYNRLYSQYYWGQNHQYLNYLLASGKNDINVVSFLKDYKNDTNKGNPVSPMSDLSSLKGLWRRAAEVQNSPKSKKGSNVKIKSVVSSR